MAGDPFKDAFRARLATHRTSAGIAAVVKDVDNTTENPDASASTLELEFPGGPPERQYSFGAPGVNWHDEVGQVTLRVTTPLGDGRDLAEVAAGELRKKFRMDRFTTSEGRTIKIFGTSPLSDGHDEGGTWVVSVFLAYQIYNVG